MATTQTTPTPDQNENSKPELLTVEKTILDLQARDYVTLVKQTAPPAPIATMEDFVSRMGNDASTILKYANVAFLEFYKDGLAENPDVPWLVRGDEDEEPEAFTGTPINPEKEKSFNLSVVNLAKTLFGYAKKMSADKEQNAELKKAAKKSARNVILSAPGSLEALK